MNRTLTGIGVVAAALLLTAGSAIPAGVSEPFRVRIVTMQGTSGPAFYSYASRSYRFVAQPSDDVAALQTEAR